MFKRLTLALFLFSVGDLQASVLPENVKIKIQKYDFNFYETVPTYLYLNGSDFKKVLYSDLETRLSDAGLLVTNDADASADLEINISYTRHYPGDATPFPSTSLASPTLVYSLKLRDSTATYIDFKSRELIGSGGAFFGAASVKDIETEVGFGLQLTNTLIDTLSSALPKERIATTTSTEQAKKSFELYTQLWQTEHQIDHDQYIPDSVADEYIAKLEAADSKTRQRIFKEITADWINNKKLFEYIKSNIDKKYKTTKDAGEVKEIREAMNAIAGSGIPEYRTYFAEIKANAADPAVASQADASEKILFRRSMQGNIVHKVKDANPQESWKINQYVRLLNFPEADVRMAAIKDIYIKQVNNTYLNKVVAKSLESWVFERKDDLLNTIEFYDWVCQVLGQSGDQQFADLLLSVSNAPTDKHIIKYAKKNYKLLVK